MCPSVGCHASKTPYVQSSPPLHRARDDRLLIIGDALRGCAGGHAVRIIANWRSKHTRRRRAHVVCSWSVVHWQYFRDDFLRRTREVRDYLWPRAGSTCWWIVDWNDCFGFITAHTCGIARDLNVFERGHILKTHMRVVIYYTNMQIYAGRLRSKRIRKRAISVGNWILVFESRIKQLNSLNSFEVVARWFLMSLVQELQELLSRRIMSQKSTILYWQIADWRFAR